MGKHHDSNCYRVMLACAKTPHVHQGRTCYRGDGTLKCARPVHVHSGGSPCHVAMDPNCGYV